MSKHLLIIITLLLATLQLRAQGPTVTASYTDEPLNVILADIKQQTDIKLAYDARSMRSIHRTVSLDDASVATALREVLETTPYEAVYIKRTWLIIPRPETPAAAAGAAPKRNFKVSGRLVDGISGEALAYANVSLEGVPGGTVTNLDGYFNIPEVAIDTIPLCMTYVGYRSRCIDLASNETENMIIKMSRADTYLMVVEVKDRQTADLEFSPIEDLVKLDAAAIARVSTGAQPDLFTAVKSLSGVSSGDGIDSQLHIRGGDEDENLVLWDGFTLYHLDHFFGVFSTLNPSVIQQVSLHKGPYSSRFGGRSGGVLDVIGRSGDRNKWRTQVNANLINLGLVVEGPVTENNSLLISFRRSHTDFLTTDMYKDILDRVFAQSISNSNEELVTKDVESDYFYHDLNLKWTWHASAKDRVSLSLFQGGDSFDRRSQLQYQPENSPYTLNDVFEDASNWGNTGLGAVWTRNPEAGRSMYTSLGWSNYASDYYFSDEQRDLFQGIPLPRVFRAKEEQNQVRDISFVHSRKQAIAKGEIEYGYQFTYLEVSERYTDRSVSDNTTRYIDSTDVANQHTIFADRTWHKSDKLSIRFGGRFGSNSFTNRLYLEPRGRINYWIKDGFGVHFASGNYIQQIRRLSEQNLFLRQADKWHMSNGGSLPESRSFHTALGVNWERGAVGVKIEVFHKRIKGVILNQQQNRILSALTLENEGILNGDGTASGLDLLIHLDHRAHSAWLSYSYTHSANKISSINEGRAFPSVFNKPHDLKLAYNYRLKSMSIHSDLMASSGYPYTPILGFYEGPGGNTYLAYGDDLSARLPALFRWDIGVSKRINFRESDLEIGFGVYNATNARNVRSRSYAIAQQRDELTDDLRINAIDLELIGINPTFSVTLDLK